MTGYSHERTESEAADWTARMDAGWSAEAEAELQAWLAADVRRHGALLAAQAAWESLDPAAVEQRRPSRFSRRGLMLSAGGALAASVAGGLVWLGSDKSYSTEAGEVRRVALADGSVATINVSSSITVDLTQHRRRAELARGEAWFQVAKDPLRPFVVEAGRVRVQAVGTAFSVRRMQGRSEILVTEGVVEAWSEGADGHRVRLHAGKRALVAENAAIWLEDGEPAALDRALAWRSGVIDLVGVPLSDAVDEFNRYNRRQIVLLDPALGNEQLDGVFQLNDPAGFAAAVRTSLNLKVDGSGDDAILIGGGSSRP